MNGATHGRLADRDPLRLLPGATVRGQRGVVLRRQLSPERPVLLRSDPSGPTRDRFRGEVRGPGEPDVAFDGGQADGEALGDLGRRPLLFNNRLDDAVTQIKRIGFHSPTLLRGSIFLQGALDLARKALQRCRNEQLKVGAA